MIVIQKTDKITENFMSWLISEIKQEILAKVDILQLTRLNIHAQEIFNVNINISNAFLQIVNNIRFYEAQNSYIIEIDPIKKINGILLVDIYRYITFGDLLVKGYPLIHDTLSNINLKLKRYLSKYNLVGVL